MEQYCHVNEPFLRATVNVPYLTDRMLAYPSVRLKMNIRDPDSSALSYTTAISWNTEDGGIMSTMRGESPMLLRGLRQPPAAGGSVAPNAGGADWALRLAQRHRRHLRHFVSGGSQPIGSMLAGIVVWF